MKYQTGSNGSHLGPSPFRARGLFRALALGAALNLAVAGAAFSQTVIKWGIAAANLSLAPALLGAVAPEVFAKHGIKLDVVDMRGNVNNCMAALISGSLDVCHLTITTGMDVVAEGGNLRTIAMTTAPLTELTVSSKLLPTLKAGPNAPLNDKLRALQGLRLVTSGPGSGNYVMLGALLKKVGMSINDLKFRVVIDPVAMVEGMKNDQIDGTMWSVGGLGTAVIDKVSVSYINIPRGDVPELAKAPYVGAFAPAAWVEKNPALAASAHAAMAEAIALLKADKGKYSALIKEKYAPAVNQAVWDDVFRQAQSAMLDGAKGSRAGWNYLLELQVADSKRDYTRASYERMVMPFAQGN